MKRNLVLKFLCFSEIWTLLFFLKELCLTISKFLEFRYKHLNFLVYLRSLLSENKNSSNRQLNYQVLVSLFGFPGFLHHYLCSEVIYIITGHQNSYKVGICKCFICYICVIFPKISFQVHFCQISYPLTKIKSEKKNLE